MNHFNSDTEIIDLISKFEDQTLARADWTHAAHLTVALFYCTSHQFGVARNLMRDGIFLLNEAHGTPNTDDSGYHETLTRFWTEAVNDFMHSRPKGEALFLIANAMIEKLGDTALPLRIYSRERLFSVTARREFVAPDLV